MGNDVDKTEVTNVTEVKAKDGVDKGFSSNGKKKGNGLMVLIVVLLIVSLASTLFMAGAMMKSGKDNKEKLAQISAELSELEKKNGSGNQTEDGQNKDIASLSESMEKVLAFVDKMSKMVDNDYGEDVAREDDVSIGGSYMIRSTKVISDAYISGDTSSLSEDQKKTLELAKEVIDKVVTDDMTDYEKELALYKWMCSVIKHDETVTIAIPDIANAADSPYGVLNNHRAVCVGYATTYRLLLQMCGIDCMVVHDTSRSHSWDLVKLGDDWYHVDIYSDAGSKNYANFNMNDIQAADSHDWNTSFFPAATGYEYCYAYANAKDFVSIEEEAKKFYDVINKGESGHFFTKLSGKDAAKNAMLLEMMANSAESYINSSELAEDCYGSSDILVCKDDVYVFTYYFTKWNDEPDEPDFPYDDDDMPTEDELEEAEEMLSNAFSNFYDNHQAGNYDWMHAVG